MVLTPPNLMGLAYRRAVSRGQIGMVVADWIQARPKVICPWFGRGELMLEPKRVQRKRAPSKGNCADKDLA